MLAGGFLRALARGFRAFTRLIITRDVLEIRHVNQPRVLPLILRRLAAQSARLL